MDKKLLVFGVFLGFVCTALGAFTYLILFTKFNLFSDFQIIRSEQILGKILALGSVLNLVFFLALLKFDKEFMARGMVLAAILTAIATVFI